VLELEFKEFQDSDFQTRSARAPEPIPCA